MWRTIPGKNSLWEMSPRDGWNAIDSLFLSLLLSVSGGVPATEVLRRGLNELTDVCEHVLDTFQVNLNACCVR